MTAAFNVNLQKPRPMNLHYHTNGSGRDSYIYGDNGGFSVLHKASSLNDGPGTMYSPKQYISKGSQQVKLSPAKGHPIHYVHNGQGRDSYISSTHGGFTAPHLINPGKTTFFNQLRSYDRSPHNGSEKRGRQNRSPSVNSMSPDGRVQKVMEDYMS